jgi:hypothetical protein
MLLSQTISSLTLCALLIGPALMGLQHGDNNNSEDAPRAKNSQKTHWKLAGMGEMEARDGTSLSFTAYESSDGRAVTLIHGAFASPEKASVELEFERTHANKIIEYGPKKDILGNTIGQRLVALAAEDRPRKTIAAVLWTRGEDIYEILSESLETALEWERKYKY